LELVDVGNPTSIRYHPKESGLSSGLVLGRGSLLFIDFTSFLPFLPPLYPILVNLFDLVIIEWFDGRYTTFTSVR
jgi:hypothetical protein